jgi:uncharacterized RDD family membrane protein YckC
VSNQYGPPGPSAPGAGDATAGGWSQPGPPAGSNYGQPNVPGYGDPAPTAPTGYPNSYPVPQATNDYARWARRVGSALIDQAPSIVGSVVFNIGYFYWLLGVMRSGSTPDFSNGVVPMIVGGALLLIGLGWTIYNRWIVAGRTGQSLGRRLTKIKLISEETGLPIGGVNAFLRDLVHILDGFAYVGYLWPLWDERRQTFADKIMRTVVVTVTPPLPV